MPTKKISIIVLVLLLFWFLPILTYAQTSTIIPSDCLVGNAEKCDLVDLVQMFANFYILLVKYLGAVGLLLLVIGGVMFITSGGNQERITRGRHIMVGTVIGLAIVLGSYVIVLNLQKFIGVKNVYQLNPSSNPEIGCIENGGQCVNCIDAQGQKINCSEPNQYSNTCDFVPNLCTGDNTRSCCVPKTN